MLTIPTVVNNVLDARVLTRAQRNQLSLLLNCGHCSDEDMNALVVLVDALSSNRVTVDIPDWLERPFIRDAIPE